MSEQTRTIGNKDLCTKRMNELFSTFPHGTSQGKIHELTGASKNAIWRAASETCKSLPMFHEIQKIADYFNVNPYWLSGLDCLKYNTEKDVINGMSTDTLLAIVAKRIEGRKNEL